MLITEKIKLKDAKPDLAQFLANQYKKNVDELEYIIKGIEPGDLKFDEGERSSVDYITTKGVDRDGEIVEPSGVVLEHYRKHPVVLFSHDYRSLPVGRCAWIKCDNTGLIAKTIYANHEEADKIYKYRKDGFPLAKSIGFVPLEVEELDSEKNNGAHRRYKRCLLLEYSDVTVPSNPDALQIAISKGLLDLLPGDTVYMNEPNIEVINVKDEGIGIKDIQDENVSNTSTSALVIEEKMMDTQGHYSVMDIFRCIHHSFHDLYSNLIAPNDVMPIPDDIMTMYNDIKSNEYPFGYTFWPGINDLFPYKYPSGNAIISFIYKGKEIMYQYPYTLDEVKEEIKYGMPVAVLPSYVKKTAEEIMEIFNIKKEIVTKPETTDSYHHMPVSGEEGKHSGHKIRTITLSRKKGVKAKYCVDDKKVISVMFPTDKFSKEEAEQWMKDHDMMKEVWEEIIETKLQEDEIDKGVIAYHDYGYVEDEEATWSAGEEVKVADIDDLKKICAYQLDSDEDPKKGDFKLPHHRQSDEKAVWNGVKAAMGALMGARGGVSIPSDDKKKVYNHIVKHYKHWDKEAPEFKEFTEGDLIAFESEIDKVAPYFVAGNELIINQPPQDVEEKAGRAISAKNRKLIQNCIDAMDDTGGMLHDLLESNDGDKSEEDMTIKQQEETKECLEIFEIEDSKEVNEDLIEFEEEDLKKILTDVVKDSLPKASLFEEIAENAIKKLRGKVY